MPLTCGQVLGCTAVCRVVMTWYERITRVEPTEVCRVIAHGQHEMGIGEARSLGMRGTVTIARIRKASPGWEVASRDGPNGAQPVPT